MTSFLYLNKVCLRVTTRLHCRSLQLQIWIDCKRGQCGLRKNHSLRRVVFSLGMGDRVISLPLVDQLTHGHNTKSEARLKYRIDQTEL